jgi:DNA polymerase-3 subunit alpha
VIQDVLLCIQTGATVDQAGRMRFESDQFYLKSAAEMRQLFSGMEEACDNTLEIAERADVEIEFGGHLLPKFDVPTGYDENSYLRKVAYDGAVRRYGEPLGEGVRQRLDYELGVIADMGFSSYFLIVWDLVAYARRRGIRVGPGRGSASGCLVAYCLGIVQIDPLKYGLIFERFLNPGRRQMPDIDMDFDERHRGEMIRYVAEKYGHDHVAQIITFSTIKARAAVRDAARVLGYPYGLGDRIAKMMPPLVMGRSTPLKACLEKTPGYEDSFKIAAPLRDAIESDPDVKRVVEVAVGLEGLRRQDSIHAAAVVISPEPLTERVPIQRKGDEAEVVTQYDMDAVERLGLLKIDFLGLRNLSVIERTRELARGSLGIDIDIDNIPLDDKKTFEMLQRGESTGVFQLEGSQMRSLLRSLRPSSLEEIAAVIALYRPGPMGSIPRYVDRKHGREPIVYPHPDLEPILSETYGVLVYQESVIEIASRIAGFSLPKADAFRKAVGKKIPELVAAQRDEFIEGCVAQGYERSFAESLFSLIEPFADYGFNKSHAFGYAMISYQTAYLKAHYPAEYFAALLSSVKDDKDKTARYLAECRSMHIRVRPPDVNTSEIDFTVKDGEIVYGLSAIRNVGQAVGEVILQARESGPFADFVDFCQRVDVSVLNKRVLEAAIKAGAFDSMGYPRKSLLAVAGRVVDDVTSRKRMEQEGQFSLFSGNEESTGLVSLSVGTEEWDREEKLAYEREMLGLYVSDHPLLDAQPLIEAKLGIDVADLMDAADGEYAVAGCLTALRSRFTKKGDQMFSFILEDLTGSIEVVCFPKAARDYSHMMKEHTIVVVTGRLETREEGRVLVGDRLFDLDSPELAPILERVDNKKVPNGHSTTFGSDGSGEVGTAGFDASSAELVAPDYDSAGPEGIPTSTETEGKYAEEAGIFGQEPVRIYVEAAGCKAVEMESRIRDLKSVLMRHHGDVPVVVKILGNGLSSSFRLDSTLWVDPTADFRSELAKVMGSAVSIE